MICCVCDQMIQIVSTTLWSVWPTTTQRQLLQSTSPRTRSVLSTTAQWLPVRTLPSSAHRPRRNFATSLFEVLLWETMEPFASRKSPCTVEVSSAHLLIDVYIMLHIKILFVWVWSSWIYMYTRIPPYMSFKSVTFCHFSKYVNCEICFC